MHSMRWLASRNFQRLLTVLALVSLVAALWAAPILPTHDGPKTLYASHVRWHLDDPAFSREFAPGYPVTSVGFTILYGCLERVFSWQAAYGLAWTLSVLTLPIAMMRLSRALHPDRRALGLLGFAGAVHWAVHMGLANFAGGLGIGLLVTAIGLERPDWSTRRELTIALLMLVAAVFHPVGGQLPAVTLGMYRLLGARRATFVREVGAISLCCVPAIAVTILSRDTLEDLHAKGIFSLRVVRLSASQKVDTLFHYFVSGPLWRVLPFLFFGAVGLALSVRHLAHPRRERKSIALLCVVAVGVLGAVLAPMDSSTWEFMQPRFLPLAIFPACALVPMERLGPTLRGLGLVALATFAVVSNGWVFREHARHAVTYASAYAGLHKAVAPGRTLLPILASPENSWAYQHDTTRPIAAAAWNLNLGQIYGVDRRAIVPYSFSFLPGIHPIEQLRNTMPRVPKRDYGEFFAAGADPARRDEELVRLASFGTTFDDVLFMGTEADAVRFVSLGYDVETAATGFRIGRFRGCPLEVEVYGASDGGSLQVGWMPSDRVVETIAIEPGPKASHRIEHGACGPMWARFLGANGARCRGGDSANQRITSDDRKLTCAIELPPTP